MKELSIFVDESGDFGEYDYHCPYYIISMVFHDQDVDISGAVSKLNYELQELGLNDHCVHTGPIIRREEDYRGMDIFERRRIFNKLVSFVRQVDISYQCFHIEKKNVKDVLEAIGLLSKQIFAFITDHYDYFLQYDVVKIYYDNGQVEVNKMLSSIFNVALGNVEFRRVIPADYKLFQVADLLCTFRLVKLKFESNIQSQSEKLFFGNNRDMKRNYLKAIEKKKMFK